MSLLVWPALCTGQFVTRGRVLASLGKSHSCETPTTSSINPSAAAISVAAGTSETIPLMNDYISDCRNGSLPVPVYQSGHRRDPCERGTVCSTATGELAQS